jgi:hypothetical protein
VIHRGDTETRRKLLYEALTDKLTYLRLANKKVGVILNFDVAQFVRNGIVRKAL